MFCTGEAPTVPGINAMFSRPGTPWSRHHATVSCQRSPAPTSTIQASSRVSSRRMPLISTFSTQRSMSCVSTRLLQPPRMNLGARPSSGSLTTRFTSASEWRCTSVWAVAGRPKVLNSRRLAPRSRSSKAEETGEETAADGGCMAEFSQTTENTMPSFDTKLDPNLDSVGNAVDTTGKEIGTRFDFKGTSAAVEFNKKDKQVIIFGDSDFQIDQVRDVLYNKLTKQKVDIRFMDVGKVEKIGGDKVKQVIKIKAGIEAELAKKITKLIKDSKLKVNASIQGEEVRIQGAKRDDLLAAMALMKKEITDAPLSFDNFRD